MDMLVKLYALPPSRDVFERMDKAGITTRRALAPEVRNRIRFEMKREVKRSRKQRKTDLKQARREWETRQRATFSASDVAG